MRSTGAPVWRLQLVSTAVVLALTCSTNCRCTECTLVAGTQPCTGGSKPQRRDDPKHPRPLEVSVGYRWFQADRDYIGDVRQSYREREHTQTINDVNLFDLDITYSLSPRTRMSVTIPFIVASRSQVLQNSQGVAVDRFATEAAGLRDMRIIGDIWLRDPEPAPQWNVSVGLGVVVPTGNDSVHDVFEILDPVSGQIRARQQPVDTSIQPGSGGWGFPLRLSGYANASTRWRAYLEGTYIVTPQDTNGVATFLPNPYEAVISIPDSYLSRAGAEYKTPCGATVGLGARIEGIPVHDLVGRSDGFRRPGYVVSVEPGASASLSDWSFSLRIPVSVYSNRLRSLADERWSAATGRYIWGDAIYPGFSIIMRLSTRW